MIGRYPTGSDRFVYLSRSGIVDDGATDNSTRLQAILDAAQAGPLAVVHDLPGVVVADGLLVWSNTTIETLRGGSWKKKGYGGISPGLGKPMFQNKHIVAGGTTPTDSNIHFRGGYWDGNRRGYSSGGTTAYWVGKGVSFGAFLANDSDQVVPVIGLYGVSGCSVRDVDFHDVPSYGLHLGNVDHAFVENVTKTLAPGDTVVGDNAIQMEGYCTFVLIVNISGQSNDDLLALNLDDGEEIYPASSPFTFQPGIVSGDCSEITVRGVTHTGGSGTLMRLLNANKTLRNVLLEDFRVASTSSSNQACIYTDAFGISGTGTYDNLAIRNVSGVVPASGLIRLINGNAVINNLTIDGVSGRGGSTPLVTMSAGTVNQLLLANCTSHGNPYLFEITGGSVADMARGPYSASGLTSDVHDAGSRITTLRRS